MKKSFIFMVTLLIVSNAHGFAEKKNVFKVTNLTQKPIQFRIMPDKEQYLRCRLDWAIVYPGKSKEVYTKNGCLVYLIQFNALDQERHSISLRPENKYTMKSMNKFEITTGVDGSLMVGADGFKRLK